MNESYICESVIAILSIALAMASVAIQIATVRIQELEYHVHKLKRELIDADKQIKFYESNRVQL